MIVVNLRGWWEHGSVPPHMKPVTVIERHVEFITLVILRHVLKSAHYRDSTFQTMGSFGACIPRPGWT